jgi:hypothetical protein
MLRLDGDRMPPSREANALGNRGDDADLGEFRVVARNEHDALVIAHRDGERDAHAGKDDGVIEGDQAQRAHINSLSTYE